VAKAEAEKAEKAKAVIAEITAQFPNSPDR
jgi:hypothetical protein